MNDLDALLTALYVKADDEIVEERWLGRPPGLTGSELVCLAVGRPSSDLPPSRGGCDSSTPGWARCSRIQVPSRQAR